jgi:hypothetical protein
MSNELPAVNSEELGPFCLVPAVMFYLDHTLSKPSTRMLMFRNAITRRQLLKTAAAGTAVSFLGLPKPCVHATDAPSGTLKITEPFSGAVLNHRHGKQINNESLTIRVSGEARPGDKVTVNGVPCRRDGNQFGTDVALHEAESEIVAVAEGSEGRQESRIRVVWDRYSEPRYRFAIDDASYFLRDIAQKNYDSLFDCFFLKGLRDLHKQYGTKFCLNIYYVSCDDNKAAADADFRLPQFPDRYKSEWADNADWLKLAFHAYANMPPNPYRDAPPEKLAADMDLIAAEIRRFAGEPTLAPPPNLHYSMSPHSAFQPMYDRGVRELSGYFRKCGDKYDINYNWDNERSAYVLQHNAWKDFESGIVFTRDSMVCNTVPVDKIVGELESLVKDPNAAEIVNLLTHEQYFWPFYYHYIPDHFQRIETAIRWVTEHGYMPVRYHEGFLGGRV